jgi:RNA polymerase sigma-70 factor (ECF subfamily)
MYGFFAGELIVIAGHFLRLSYFPVASASFYCFLRLIREKNKIMIKIEAERAFIEIIRQHERVIYKVCSFYTSDEFPLADLYQEVICNLWAGFTKFRNECSVSTWIYRVAMNTCISGMRKERNRPKHNVPVSTLADSLVKQESMEEDIREMYSLINRLKTIEKTIVLLYLEERSYQEIADITGLSVGNIASKLNRIKEKLKKMSNL